MYCREFNAVFACCITCGLVVSSFMVWGPLRNTTFHVRYKPLWASWGTEMDDLPYDREVHTTVQHDSRDSSGNSRAISQNTCDHRRILSAVELQKTPVHSDGGTAGVFSTTPLLFAMNETNNILVVGEGRSGTSLLHDIVTSTTSENVFAGFEPYAGFFREAESTRLHVSFTPIGGLRALFNCSFALREGAVAKKGRQGSYRLRNAGQDCVFKTNQASDKQVYPRAIYLACKSQATRVMKIIRFRENFQEDPEREVPGIRVLHLLRHPIPLLRSRMRMSFLPTLSPVKHADRMCREMFQRVMYLRAKIPTNQLLEVKYEDMESPFPNDGIGRRAQQWWSRLLQFLGSTTQVEQRMLAVQRVLQRGHQGHVVIARRAPTQWRSARRTNWVPVASDLWNSSEAKAVWQSGECADLMRLLNYSQAH
eukprot:m.59424 g.59424  ORF g.59424 m.59424 type:complete len:423 (+) comp15697_c0_seq1:241-1509(+)